MIPIKHWDLHEAFAEAMFSPTARGPRCPRLLVSDLHQGAINGQGLPGCRNEILRHLYKVQPVRRRQARRSIGSRSRSWRPPPGELPSGASFRQAFCP
jgi:hypothetical protein